MAMTVPRQNIALLSVLVNQSQAARLNRAQDVSPELVRQPIHRLIVYFERDGAIREDLSRIFELVKGKLVAFFAKEKEAKRLAKNASAELLADFCIATIQGAMLVGKVKKNSRPVEATVRETLAHLKGYSVAQSKRYQV
jgi:hypothetical protein